MRSTMRSAFALAATALALAGGLAVAGPAHAEPQGTHPVAARTSSLAPVPDDTSASGSVRQIRIKGTQVALRECPRTSCGVVTRVSNTALRAFCQTSRHTTKVSGNKWWTKVTLLHGSDPAWVSNHYIRGAAPKVPHLSGC